MIRTLTAIAGLCLATTATGQEVAPADASYDDMGAISVSLSGVPGDPAAGEAVMTTQSLGNCIACHQVSSQTAEFPGNVGPSLDGTGSRWDEAQLRGIVSNAKMTFPDTVMPSFYKSSGYIRPGDAYTGKAGAEPLPPLLTAQQIEDVVAYLTTLTD